MAELRKHYPGCYRITLTDQYFGQIKLQGRQWHAEIRDADSGMLVRYAGIWKTRREAVDELLSEKLPGLTVWERMRLTAYQDANAKHPLPLSGTVGVVGSRC